MSPKAIGFTIALGFLGLIVFVTIGILANNWWAAGVTVLIEAILYTFLPIIVAFLGFKELNPPGDWFDSSERLGEQQARLVRHYSRIQGTLRFWKNKAAAHYRLHLARVMWSLISAVGLPVLVQRFDKTDAWSVLFMTILTTWSGLVTALAYTLKSEEKYQGFRQQESDFYDTSRRLLDSIAETELERKRQADEYISTIESVRRVARRVETSSPPSAL